MSTEDALMFGQLHNSHNYCSGDILAPVRNWLILAEKERLAT